MSADVLQVSSVAVISPNTSIAISSNVEMNGGVTLAGPDGYISSQSSFTASSFFGDGSHLTGVVILTSTETLTAAYTFTSSFTVQSGGRAISFSTGSIVQNFVITPAGNITFEPQMHNSSTTVIPEFSTTISSYGPCVAGSTLTITTAGGELEISFTGALSDTANYGWAGIAFLLDGAFVSGMSDISGFRTQFAVESGQSFYRSMNAHYLTAPLVAGTHSVCLSLCDASFGGASGTATIYSSGTDYPINAFYVKELK